MMQTERENTMTKQESRKRSSSRFTILELLIVISVIAILAALLLPALNKARTSAQTAACTGQVKQLVTANAMYMGDFDDWIYPFYTDFYRQTWVRALEPYLFPGKLEEDRFRFSSEKTAKLFLCPGDVHTFRGRKDNAACTENSCGGLLPNRQSYGINYFFQEGASPDRIGKRVNELMVKDSHGSFSIRAGGFAVYLTEVKWNTPDHYHATGMGRMDLLRHDGRNNIAFLDCSVRAYVTSGWLSVSGAPGTYFDERSFYSNFLKR